MRNSNHIRHMNNVELRKMQLIELELLLEVDRICRKHKIRYNICGGTLIGAKRHGGFIPWDDDIDIRMLRNEYIKFKKACNKEMDYNNYFLQDFTTDSKYRWGYAKLLKNNTCYIREGQEHLGMKNGVFIDIFISDGIPNNKAVAFLHNKVCFSIQKILWSPVGAKISKSLGMRIWYKLLSLIPRSVSIYAIHVLSSIWSAENCNHIRALTFPQKRGLKKEWFTELEEITFEGHKVLAPKDAEGWLKQEYGNYMQLPPEDKRIPHSPASYYYF